MREYFSEYVSNSLAATGNQAWFSTESADTLYTGRTFYKVFHGGTMRYSFLFSNIIDSTFADGEDSFANFICETWRMHSLKVAVTKDVTLGELPMQNVTFCGNLEKTVHPAEIFHTDAIELTAEKGEYICLEMAFYGTVLPYLEEILIPAYRKAEGGAFEKCNRVPLAQMVGCDRKVDKRIAFWGDSITEGIGTPENSYAFWAARFAELCGGQNAYWNLGIGCGRAVDAASGGSWFYKAKQADIVFVCFGVNDIFHVRSAEEIQKAIGTIVKRLSASSRVILLTVPPFDYAGESLATWRSIVEYEKALPCEVFDTSAVWGMPNAPHRAKYGGHPNEIGSEEMANALYREVRI